MPKIEIDEESYRQMQREKYRLSCENSRLSCENEMLRKRIKELEGLAESKQCPRGPIKTFKSSPSFSISSFGISFQLLMAAPYTTFL